VDALTNSLHVNVAANLPGNTTSTGKNKKKACMKDKAISNSGKSNQMLTFHILTMQKHAIPRTTHRAHAVNRWKWNAELALAALGSLSKSSEQGNGHHLPPTVTFETMARRRPLGQ
jgi:hypothetical protein